MTTKQSDADCSWHGIPLRAKQGLATKGFSSFETQVSAERGARSDLFYTSAFEHVSERTANRNSADILLGGRGKLGSEN